MLQAARSGETPAADTAPTTAAVATAARPPAPAVRRHGNAGAAFAIGASVDAVFHHDKGYDLFANDDVAPRLGLWAGHDLAAFSRDLILAAELGWGVESEEQPGLYGGSLHTTLVTHTFQAGASLRWVLLPWLQPQLRLAGGASQLHMELTSGTELTNKADAVSPLGSLGAGVLLRTPTRLFENNRGELASLSFGVLIEAGYALRGAVNFKLTQPQGPRDIAVSGAKLGELSLSGPYIRTSVVVRF